MLMTNGGGAGVMAADAAGLAGVPLCELSERVRDKLNAVLPPTWSHANPIEIIGDAPVRRYTETLQALLADRDSGAVLFLHAPTAIVRSDDIARACAPIVRQAPGRVMACWLGDAAVADARRVFEDAGVANYATPEDSVRAFAMLATYRRNQALLLEAPTAGAAATAGRELGYPVALKILSPDISHKSDVGGVRLNLRDENELRHAADEMLARVRETLSQARITGFTVQTIATCPLAQELIVGASIDPVFGTVLLFGQGGTAVEVLADRAIALPPLNRVLARELVSRTRVAKLLTGYRDHLPIDFDSICDVLIAMSQILADLPELAELDINPLLADHDGVVALDARLRVTRGAGAGAANFAITPYLAELAETVSWQGETIVLRPIRPEDEPQHRAFIELLQPQDLRLRFFSVRREMLRSELARLWQIDYSRGMAFIAVRSLQGGTAQTLGVVRALIDPDNVDAEFAIIVRSDLKAHGLGHMLLRKMIEFLSRRGTQRMVGDVLRDNEAMRELARSLCFLIDTAASNADAFRIVLTLTGRPELTMCIAAPAIKK